MKRRSFLLIYIVVPLVLSIYVTGTTNTANASIPESEAPMRPYAVLGSGIKEPESHQSLNPDDSDDFTDEDEENDENEEETEDENGSVDSLSSSVAMPPSPNVVTTSPLSTEEVARESLRKSLVHLQKLLLSMAAITFLFIVLYSSYYIYMLKSAYKKEMVTE